MRISSGWHLIELIGHRRLVGELAPCDEGGFFIEEIGRDGRISKPIYYGPLAIFRMWPCSEGVARATAAKERIDAVDLPAWAADCVDKPVPPPEPPKPTPPPRLQAGDIIGILTQGGTAVSREWVGVLTSSGGDPFVREGEVLSRLEQQPRWIRRNNVTIWEREPGQCDRDMDDFPF